jgi:hypothetical protein
MSRYLWNRECQLRLITFRPFISLLAQQLPRDGLHEYQLRILYDGARRYLTHALQFIYSQARSPERHYGTWLLARNLFTVALTILSACNTPLLLERMDHTPRTPSGMPNWQASPTGSGDMESPASEGTVCSYHDALFAVDKALDIMRHWAGESPSIDVCVEMLSMLLARTRDLRG